MRQPTPFFAAFGSLLFGRRPRGQLGKLLGDTAGGRSLSQYQEAFGEFIPQALLHRTKEKENSRERIFTPQVTFWAFLAQVLERGSACRNAVRRVLAWCRHEAPQEVAPSGGTGAYCQARTRLPGPALTLIGTDLAERLERNVPSAALWLGRRVKIIDGTTATMPDTEANQAVWPQPHSQKPGCGFPLVKLVGLLSQASGALLHVVEGTHRQHDMALARQLWPRLEPGDVLLADRGFCSYHDLSVIAARGADAVLRLHQARKVDFAQGEVLGPDDRLVVWQKPRQRPPGCTPEEYAAQPATQRVRLVRYRVATPGFRTQEVILVTTLLDPVAYPATALAALYAQRWDIELHLREIKTLLGLDVLRCLTPEMVRKEIAMQRVAYQLVRVLMQRAALQHQVPLARISFKGTLDSLHHFAGTIQALTGRTRRQKALLEDLLRTIARDLLPHRPGRVEPRAKKRRPKNYHLLTKPRRQMKIVAHRSRPSKNSRVTN